MTTMTSRGTTHDGPAPAGGAAPRELCPKFHRTIELVGKRWTGAIVEFLMEGPQRFTALRRAAPGLHDRLLSQRLKELEAEGLVTRSVYADTPVHIDYALTERGRDLEKVFGELHRWADRWIGATPDGTGRRDLEPTESTRASPRRRALAAQWRRGSPPAGAQRRR
jgi:DNA-binding HxlR family transcriptional regulator